MNGFLKIGVTFFGLLLSYDLMKRRFAIKHAETLNDQQIRVLESIKGLLETGKVEVPKEGLTFQGLYVADQHPSKDKKKE